MIDFQYSDLFYKSNVDKQIEIAYSGGTITNEEMFSESMELSESLCSESELRFGSCEASSIKFKIANIFLPMFGHEIGVLVKLENHHDTPFMIGRFKVVKDTPTADRRWRDIEAYDAMYDILNADAADWYNRTLPNEESKMTLRNFRKSFLDYMGVAESDTSMELVNDDMTVNRTIAPERLSGMDVITKICEINGCFGHIDRDGNFAYIYLPQYIQGLYPANDLYPDHAPDYLPYMQETGHLYPKDPLGIKLGGDGGAYIHAQYEDFQVKEIKRLQIRKEENDIGVIINEQEDGNTYIIQDNFLVYGKGTDELKKIGENILSKIRGIVYRPYDAELLGNPCIEVGDPVRLSTQYQIIESYVLERTLKGGQSLRDTFSAQGIEEYTDNLNSMHTSIVELKGKSNVLTRTIEETKSEIVDVEKNLSSTITQTAESITTELTKKIDAETKRATDAEGNLGDTVTSVQTELSSKIEQTAESITTEVNKKIDEETKRAKEAESGLGEDISSVHTELSSTIEQTAESITSEVNKKIDEETKRASDAENGLSGTIESVHTELSSTIEQTAESIASSINSEVERAKEAEAGLSDNLGSLGSQLETVHEELSSTIEQTATSITAEITKESERATKAESALGTSISSVSETLNAKIEATEENINLSISSTLETSKEYVNTQLESYSTTEESQKYVDGQLESYSTTESMESAIELAKDSITSSVSETYETKTAAKSSYDTLSSSIEQTAKNITSEVAKKVGDDEIISKINQSAEKITIKASKISLEGTVTANQYFKILEDGSMEATNGNFTNGEITIKSGDLTTYIGGGEYHVRCEDIDCGVIYASKWMAEPEKKGLSISSIGSSSYLGIGYYADNVGHATLLYAKDDLYMESVEGYFPSGPFNHPADTFGFYADVLFFDRIGFAKPVSGFFENEKKIGYMYANPLRPGWILMDTELLSITKSNKGEDVSDTVVDIWGGVSLESYYVTSDERLKYNIEPSTKSGLDVINQIDLYSYDWIDSGRHVDTGMIAQQLEDISPELAQEIKADETYGINMTALFPYVIKAIKELDEKCSAYQTQISELKGEPVSPVAKISKLARKKKWEPQYTLEEKKEFVKNLQESHKMQREHVEKPVM